ncbi:MAG: choice-of-anchor Q domain-containing protein [Chloroflexota bacterium]
MTRLTSLLILLTLLTLQPVVAAVHPAATTIPCGDTVALNNALFAASTNAAGDTISLAADCTYILTQPLTIAADGGQPLTITGSGTILDADTLPGAPTIALTVQSGADVTLNNVTITDAPHFAIQIQSGASLAMTGGGVRRGQGTIGIQNQGTFNANGISLSEHGGTALSATATAQTTLSDVTITDNDVPGSGGGISNQGTMNITASVLTGNTADYGGAIRNGGTLIIEDSTFSQNTARIAGGAVFNTEQMTLRRLTFTDNSADATGTANIAQGGAIFNDGGMLTIEASTFSGNALLQEPTTASDCGGAIASGGIFRTAADASLSIADSMFENNTSLIHGGAICADGETVITDSTISGSQAAYGGAVYASGTLQMVNSTLHDNNATAQGGALYATASSAVQVYSSTIHGNSAGNQAGGIYATAPVTIRSSALDSNTAPAAPTLVGQARSDGFNLFSTTPQATFNGGLQPTDIVGISAMLLPLADNGGPTFTMLPDAVSPVVDAGNCDGLSTDQRGTGYPRQVDFSNQENTAGGDGCDIGAVERQDLPLTCRDGDYRDQQLVCLVNLPHSSNADSILDGGGGDDTLIIVQSVTVGGVNGDGPGTAEPGTDVIIVEGTVSGDVNGDGTAAGADDSITIRGTVGGQVNGDAGDDTVTITEAARGGDNTLPLNGGAGVDTLQFDLPIIDRAEADALQAQIDAGSPDNGSLTYNGQTFNWTDFETVTLLTDVDIPLTITEQQFFNALAAAITARPEGMVAFVLLDFQPEHILATVQLRDASAGTLHVRLNLESVGITLQFDTVQPLGGANADTLTAHAYQELPGLFVTALETLLLQNGVTPPVQITALGLDAQTLTLVASR